eukprot:EC812952.1.p1 GENE.EC812952.1~~EC812952.1.p1  ORF type:complete len:124 (+),score=40.76 EC812952.1:1-372(+)
MAHTTMRDLHHIEQNKAHVMEIQVNGGSIADKLTYAKGLLEQHEPVTSVFQKDEMIDVISITEGHGYEGVVHRGGVKRLPRKTDRGLRRVACIGAWHPSRVMFSVVRAGQNGFDHRTEVNKKI